MKAVLVIDIDENHLLKESNELYERLRGYKCELKPLPQKKTPHGSDLFNDYVNGWNDCIDAIVGETE